MPFQTNEWRECDDFQSVRRRYDKFLLNHLNCAVVNRLQTDWESVLLVYKCRRCGQYRLPDKGEGPLFDSLGKTLRKTFTVYPSGRFEVIVYNQNQRELSFLSSKTKNERTVLLL